MALAFVSGMGLARGGGANGRARKLAKWIALPARRLQRRHSTHQGFAGGEDIPVVVQFDSLTCGFTPQSEPLPTANADPATTTLYFGFDWMEQHRLDAVTGRLHKWRVDAPLLWPPLISKPDILEMLRQAGVDIPAAYQVGMPHNNCLKYGCVKGGIAYWRQVLDVFPDAYARSEEAENNMRQTLGKDIAILRDRRGGMTVPLTLTTLRERSGSQPSLFADSDEWAACACF